MKIHGSLVLLGLTLLFSTCANAVQTSASEASQVRVLLSFDNSGHHVRKVVFTADTLSTPAIEKRDILAADLELPSLEDRLESGMATIIWSNNRMETIAVTTEPDPRLSHSPAFDDSAASELSISTWFRAVGNIFRAISEVKALIKVYIGVAQTSLLG